MKNTDTHEVVLPTGDIAGKATASAFAEIMNLLIKILTKLGLLKKDLDYHVVRASMVIIYFFFGYQKWFPYEAQTLIPFISNGPLISWMYPVFGIQGASWFLGASEWLFGALLLLGFGSKKLGILGAAGFLRYLYHDLYDSSVYARWRECRCRWLPRHARECGLPDEGPGALRLAAGQDVLQ
jgi:uncharacterized membrane protein YphA (DoxX/SURF4 family)